MNGLAIFSALMVLLGLTQAAAGHALVRRFMRTRAAPPPAHLPPLSVLKPLYGAEPLLEEALASLCAQDYPAFEVIFGVQNPDDPAIGIVKRLRARFPARDLVLVIDPTPHGRNRKVGNLMNMLPFARHEMLVIADSDVHCAPDYLKQIAAALQAPGVGLVTTLYAGLPASAAPAAALGATAITHSFLPGALMARALGRQDCLGATMALRRRTLHAIGGFGALVHHLADDAILGQLVRARGLEVALAGTVPATTVPESGLRPLVSHELRWGRTIASLVPLRYALSAIQYPLAWALICLAASGFEEWGWAVFLGAWLGRAAIGRAIDRALGLAQAGLAGSVPIWLLPLRDVLSVGIVLASYASDRVRWRGEELNIGVVPPHMAGMHSDAVGD